MKRVASQRGDNAIGLAILAVLGWLASASQSTNSRAMEFPPSVVCELVAKPPPALNHPTGTQTLCEALRYNPFSSEVNVHQEFCRFCAQVAAQDNELRNGG